MRTKKPALCFRIFLGIILILGLTAAQAIGAEKMKKDNPFGVLAFLHWNDPWNNYKYPDKETIKKAAKLMRSAGVGMVRMDFLWQDIEPRQGEFQFQKYDYIVKVLTENKIAILGLLNYSTPWAAACTEWNCPPQDNQLFVRYAVTTATRYKDKIKYWEIWNEPDSRTYWAKQDGLKGYVGLLKDVYVALKKAVPDCKILNGGLANGLSSVNLLYDNGAKGYFDILNIHIFESPLHPGAIKRVCAYPVLAYKVMARNGDGNKKIWVTEIGCPGIKKGTAVGAWWLGENPDEKEQAVWLESVFTQLSREKSVERIFWAFFRDCKEHWNNGVDYFGLLRWDFSRKPAFFSFRKFFRKRITQ
jgi:hypothetical protein